tara:strand:- start:53 stop:490 length:438 start_codon:yes stop_codon:yes gene_type:complete
MIHLENKDIYYWQDIEEIVSSLAEQILKLEKQPLYLCGLPRGGLVPAVLLSHLTGIKYQQINSISISKMADLSHVLIIDDICDSGKTLENVKKTYPKARTLTLFTKLSSSIQPDIYSKVVNDDKWIIFPWEKQSSETSRDNTPIL